VGLWRRRRCAENKRRRKLRAGNDWSWIRALKETVDTKTGEQKCYEGLKD
jgi:hypothetical protein